MELLALLAGWTRAPRAGGAVLAGPRAEVIEIRNGVRPIPSLRSLAGADARIERLTTLEGEAAALAVGERSAIAIAVGDDCATVIRGSGGDEVARSVRELAIHTYLGLGELRRRRYVYAPPAGWLGLAQHHAARWLHPRFPPVPHTLTVFDARPAIGTASELVDALLVTSTTHGRRVEAPHPLAATRTPGGLGGAYARIDLRDRGAPASIPRERSIIRCHLRDERFAYVVELAGPSASIAADLPVLEAVVASIEAVHPRTAHDVADRVLYWGD
jgi:hypothetical protein